VLYSSLFFVLLMVLIGVAKPALLFKPDGSLRPFGTRHRGAQPHTTVVSLGVVTVAAAVLSMFVFSLIDLVYETGGGGGGGGFVNKY
jgi:hypothetical protein